MIHTMNIPQVCKFLKKIKRKDVNITKHTKVKCEEREIDVKKIHNLLKTHKIFGILEQKEHQYMVCLNYNDEKDIYIIFHIINDNRIRLITAYLSSPERRLRLKGK